MSDEAKLQITVVERRLDKPAHAFWFGFAENCGKIFGGLMGIGIALLVFSWASDWKHIGPAAATSVKDGE